MLEDQRWDEWEKRNKEKAQEFEHIAFEKCDNIGETFLAHYFEPRMCLRCFGVHMFSVLRTRKDWKSGESQITTRRWCTNCGSFHFPQHVPVTRVAYEREKKRKR